MDSFLRGVRGDQMPLNNSDFHLPYNQKLITRAKELRKNATIPEKKLWQEYLRFLKPRFLRQRSIDNFIVDFYCASCKFVIEIDGGASQFCHKYKCLETKNVS